MLFFRSWYHDESQVTEAGQIAFSFNSQSSDGVTGGRTLEGFTPAFVSYSVKKVDVSTINEKIQLLEFNGSFVTAPQQLMGRYYTLAEFQILDSNYQTIYASPLAGSPLADLVKHPLPLSFNVTEMGISTEIRIDL